MGEVCAGKKDQNRRKEEIGKKEKAKEDKHAHGVGMYGVGMLLTRPRYARQGAHQTGPHPHRFSERSEEEGVGTPGPPRTPRARAAVSRSIFGGSSKEG